MNFDEQLSALRTLRESICHHIYGVDGFIPDGSSLSEVAYIVVGAAYSALLPQVETREDLECLNIVVEQVIRQIKIASEGALAAKAAAKVGNESQHHC